MPGPTIVRPQPGDEITSGWGQSVADALNGIQVGTVTISVSAASNGTAVLTFPKAYVAPPIVLTAVRGVGSNTQAHSWIATAGITATQATIAAGRDDSTTFTQVITVSWIAIGTLA